MSPTLNTQFLEESLARSKEAGVGIPPGKGPSGRKFLTWVQTQVGDRQQKRPKQASDSLQSSGLA